MENTPKYKIGDKVFRIKDGKIVEETIYGIHTSFADKGFSLTFGRVKEFICFEYFLDKEMYAEKYSGVKESDLFITKEELIASL